MAVAKTNTPEIVGVNFGDLEMYVAGGGIPPGKYALEFTVQMFQATNAQGASKGPARLGVMVKAHSLTDPSQAGDNAHSQFYSMGSSADKSFAPHPVTGKGVVPVPGGPATTFNNSTNWAIFLKSLYDCGLPKGIFSNDLTVLDGVHVQTTIIPEPEERKGFQSSTAEAQAERKSGQISIVSEIMDDGKPWEGGGGIPTPGTAPAKGKVNGAVKTKPVAAPTPVAEAPAGAPDEADILAAAIGGASEVLEQNLKGLSKLKFRAGVFVAVQKKHGDQMASSVQDTFWTNDTTLTSLLDQLGYKIVGPEIKPA